MAVREVLRMGHPVLREKSRPVENPGSAELLALVADMKETMAAQDGAGLAAPQIGVSQRVVIFGVESNPRYPDAEPVPFTVLVNPKLTFLTRDVESDWEGCLSVPGMRGVVPRYTKLRYTGFDELGNPIDRVAEGFHARVVQHEVDHLDGILYPQRMTDMSTFGFTKELFPGEEIADD
jgi:peptide deformylase